MKGNCISFSFKRKVESTAISSHRLPNSVY